MKEILLPALCGFLTGILSAWGVGGGTLLLLCMTLFLQVEQRTAQIINLIYFLPTAGVSLLVHWRRGYLDGPTWRAGALPGALAAAAAAGAALFLDPRWLRKPFGVYLLWAGLSMLVKLWLGRLSKG